MGLSESLAAAWLIAQGWEVYQQVGQCKVDLLAHRPDTGELIRVEVKTASNHRTVNGESRFYWSERDAQTALADMFLVVSRDGRVFDATGLSSPLVDVSEPLVKPVKVKKPKGKKPVRRSVLDADGNRRM